MNVPTMAEMMSQGKTRSFILGWSSRKL